MVKLLTPELFSSSRAARFDGVRPMTWPPSFSIARRATSRSVDFPGAGGSLDKRQIRPTTDGLNGGLLAFI